MDVLGVILLTIIGPILLVYGVVIFGAIALQVYEFFERRFDRILNWFKPQAVGKRATEPIKEWPR